MILRGCGCRRCIESALASVSCCVCTLLFFFFFFRRRGGGGRGRKTNVQLGGPEGIVVGGAAAMVGRWWLLWGGRVGRFVGLRSARGAVRRRSLRELRSCNARSSPKLIQPPFTRPAWVASPWDQRTNQGGGYLTTEAWWSRLSRASLPIFLLSISLFASAEVSACLS